MDIWTKEKRSEVMSKIKGKNTKPEKLLRSALFALGYRYRLHSKNLPGKPDIVFPKYRTAIFVHGCFWHYHKECKEGRVPSTNSIFWEQKLSANVKRDLVNIEKLKNDKWRVYVVWECEIEKNLDKTVRFLTSKLKAKKWNSF